MSLMDIRTDWLKLSRAVDIPVADRYHVVVAATFTAEPIVPYLGMDLANAAPSPPVISIAPYNQLFQLCLNWEAEYAGRKPDAIVLLWRIEDLLREEFGEFLIDGGIDAAFARLDELAAAIRTLKSSFDGVVVAAIPPFPHSPDHHIRALRSAREGGRFHRRLVERWIDQMEAVGGVSLLDLDGLQRAVGIQGAADWRKWYLYRQPFTEIYWREAAADLAALLRAQTVAAKKCIVVDCDNTLWGGVIGEDGLEGIAIGEDFPGSAFRDFQRQLIALRAQGVMIALCSKNNEQDVWDVFDRHDGMVLKREHVLAWRINWDDKAGNIVGIAEDLNIGLDSLVFVDDSAMELERVRSALPMVTCLEVPEDLSAYSGKIAAYRGFDRESISAEDRSRSDMMAQERDRRELATAVSGEEFRKALELKVDLFEVGPEHVGRTVQLINKTNQFNLTTARKTQPELTALMQDEASSVLAWRVSDRFGDYGLVGVAIIQLENETAELETLLMSCRVLGRGVETSILSALADFARARGASRLLGRYIETNKNALVADLYADHGFVGSEAGAWVLDDLGAITWPAEIVRPGL